MIHTSKNDILKIGKDEYIVLDNDICKNLKNGQLISVKEIENKKIILIGKQLELEL